MFISYVCHIILRDRVTQAVTNYLIIFISKVNANLMITYAEKKFRGTVLHWKFTKEEIHLPNKHMM